MPRKKRSASPFELMDDDFDDNSSQSSRNGNPPIQRNAANARERARMRVLSSAFGRLKTKLPNIPADTKLSKLDTLRLATMYIKQLKMVVEGGAGASAAASTNGDLMEGSLNNNGNNATHNYLNLNTGVQSMNWPFGFHHHLSNSSLIRSSPANSLINNNTSNNNWSPNGDNNNEEHLKPLRYDNENYEHNHSQHHQQQTSSYIQQTTTLTPQNHNHQPNHWYSETPSPELDSTSSTCLTFENSHLQHQTEQQQQHYHHQQQHHHHNHHHNLTHLQAESTHSSTTFQLQHDFHHHQHPHYQQQHQPSSQLHHLHQNAFVNSSNFQSTSIR